MENKELSKLESFPYQVKIITDTLFYTIIKVIIKGNIPSPTLLVDSGSLVGATFQSALAQFGGGLPNLPDIHCIKSSISASSKCNSCNNNNYKPPSYNYCNNSMNMVNPISGSGSSALNSNNNNHTTGFIYSQKDLVSFSPSQISPPYYNDFMSNSNNLNSGNSIPLLYGVSESTAKISYAIVSTDSFEELMSILNKIANQNKIGKWIHECGPEFRFAFKGINTYTLRSFSNNLDLDSFLQEISSIIINGYQGIWITNNNIEYSFCSRDEVTWSLKIVPKKSDNINFLIESLNKININASTGVWKLQGSDKLVRQIDMISRNIKICIKKIEEDLNLLGWSLVKLDKDLYIYENKEGNQLELYRNNNTTKVSAETDVMNNFINKIAEINNWSYSRPFNWNKTTSYLNVTKKDNNYILEATNNDNILKEIKKQLLQEDWLVENINEKSITQIKLNINKDLLIHYFKDNNWTYTINNQFYIFKNKDKPNSHIELNEFSGQLFIKSDRYLIDQLIKDLLDPYDINYEYVCKQEIYKIQLIRSRNGQYIIYGSEDLLDFIYEELPYLFEKPYDKKLQFISIKNLNLSLLNRNWIRRNNNEIDLFYYKNNNSIYIQSITANNITTIWGEKDAIELISNELFKLKISYETEQLTNLKLSVFNLKGNQLPLSVGIENYQIVADKFIIENLYSTLKDFNNCGISTELKYTSITINVNINIFLEALKNYDYGIGNLGWKQDETSHIGCSPSNLFRFYSLVDGGQEIATPFFIYVFSLSNNNSENGFCKIEGTQNVINKFIDPIIKSYNWNNIKAGSAPKINNFTLNVGKVVGLTGNIQKLPTCDAIPLLAITNINWTINNSNNQKNYVELLWQTEPDQIIEECELSGESAFIFSDSGNYGIGSLNTNNGNTLVDGGGQPAIPNTASPNPTGNILFKTNGSLSGTFTIKLQKYSGYYNYINFFNNAANNLQAAIQANELLQRDMIMVYKRINEENYYLNLLKKIDMKDRSRLMPNRNNNNIIYNKLVGQIELSLLDETNITDIDIVTQGIDIQTQFRKVLSEYLGIKLNNISIAILKKKFNVKNNINYYKYQYNINIRNNLKISQVRLPFNNINRGFTFIPNNNEYAKKIKKKIDNLIYDIDDWSQKYIFLKDIVELHLTSYLLPYIINHSNNNFITDYNDYIASMSQEFKLINKIANMDQFLRVGVRQDPLGGVDPSNQNNQISNVNANNYSVWLERQLTRLFYGSERDIPIYYSEGENPSNINYTWENGKPVYGFLNNAFSTEMTLPIDKPPEIINTNNIQKKKNINTFTNYKSRVKQNFNFMGNTNSYKI